MIYLDNAATSWPKPAAVTEALAASAASLVEGCGLPLIAETRRHVAEFFGVADPARVILMHGLTDAIGLALRGVALAEGEPFHAVATALDHLALSRPLDRMEARGRITLTRIMPNDEGLVTAEAVAAAMTPHTRLVALAHASNVTGIIQPIRAIAQAVHARGGLLLVDAGQTAGLCDIQVDRDTIDILAFASHKGLLGFPGAGGLCLGDAAILAGYADDGHVVRPLREKTLPDEYPYAADHASPLILGMGALTAGIRYINQTGRAGILAHVQQLTEQTLAGLRQLSGVRVLGDHDAERIGIVSFVVEGVPNRTFADRMLGDHRVIVRGGLHRAANLHRHLGTAPEGAVRVSLGYANTESDIDTFLHAMEACQHNPQTALERI